MGIISFCLTSPWVCSQSRRSNHFQLVRNLHETIFFIPVMSCPCPAHVTFNYKKILPSNCSWFLYLFYLLEKQDLLASKISPFYQHLKCDQLLLHHKQLETLISTHMFLKFSDQIMFKKPRAYTVHTNEVACKRVFFDWDIVIEKCLDPWCNDASHLGIQWFSWYPQKGTKELHLIWDFVSLVYFGHQNLSERIRWDCFVISLWSLRSRYFQRLKYKLDLYI